jgi:hypothetical protein
MISGHPKAQALTNVSPSPGTLASIYTPKYKTEWVARQPSADRGLAYCLMHEQESQRVHHIFMQQTLIEDRYALGNLLGSGGMAEVYLAHDDILDRDVALKVLRDQYVKHEEFVERFRREAKSAAALNYPNIVSAYDWGCSGDGSYYMAMEYVPGGTLKERILSDSPTDPDKASEWSSQAARALGFAHERGVIHFYEGPGEQLWLGGHCTASSLPSSKPSVPTTD